MDFLTFIFLIVVVSLIAARSMMKYRHLHPISADPARMNQLENSVARLEQRLANIETIVTDRDYHLNREFEQLERSEHKGAGR